jgi:hypothetical protein
MEKSYAQHYALLEGEHWWFRARRVILRALFAQLEWPQQPRILEIGVGPGHNLLEVYPPDARLDVMMALQCLTCSNILKMTHARSRS